MLYFGCKFQNYTWDKLLYFKNSLDFCKETTIIYSYKMILYSKETYHGVQYFMLSNVQHSFPVPVTLNRAIRVYVIWSRWGLLASWIGLLSTKQSNGSYWCDNQPIRVHWIQYNSVAKKNDAKGHKNRKAGSLTFFFSLFPVLHHHMCYNVLGVLYCLLQYQLECYSSLKKKML